MREQRLYGCGQCGREGFLTAAMTTMLQPMNQIDLERYHMTFTAEPCDDCIRFRDEGIGYIGDDEPVIDVPTLLGWCGCGSPESVTEVFTNYLSALLPPSPPGGWTAGQWSEGLRRRLEACGNNPVFEMTVAYICDDLEWTEHGGSVRGAWLTELGVEARDNLIAARAKRDAICAGD